MTVRVLFKVDSIASTEHHVDYERDEHGFPQRTKPTTQRTTTINLSVVDPGHDPKKLHQNSALWKNRPSGRLVLTDVDDAVIAALIPAGVDKLQSGTELAIDISLPG
jgi:hypothetical protein